MIKILYMLPGANLRQEAVASLAIRLRRNQLSADDLQTEMSGLTRAERASALVEFSTRWKEGLQNLRAADVARRPKCHCGLKYSTRPAPMEANRNPR